MPAGCLVRRVAEQRDDSRPGLLHLIHRMLDRQQFGGRPWDHALPPPMPGRYSLAHQFRKRILNRLRSRAQEAR